MTLTQIANEDSRVLAMLTVVQSSHDTFPSQVCESKSFLISVIHIT
jgi:hypothetical protein